MAVLGFFLGGLGVWDFEWFRGHGVGFTTVKFRAQGFGGATAGLVVTSQPSQHCGSLCWFTL